MTTRAPRIVATVVLGLPSAAAIYGSAANLVVIAAEQRLSDPRVLPFCLDILAIGIVVTTVFCGHDDRLSRVTPWLAYGSSAVLQVTEVWPAGPRAWAVHALPLAAAILGTETVLRLWRPEVAAEPVAAVAPALEVSTLEPVTELAAPGPVVAARRPVTPRRPRPGHRRAERPVSADPEVVALVEQACAELGVDPQDTTRDTVLKHLRRDGRSAPHATKVGPALRHLKENPHEQAPATP